MGRLSVLFSALTALVQHCTTVRFMVGSFTSSLPLSGTAKEKYGLT